VTAARYEVRRGDELTLLVTDEPGPLVSVFAPPPDPGEPPTLHAFVSVASFVPEAEEDLLRILDDSASTASYLDRLRAAGYTVEQVS
jgi:hypothetical protein